jgi:hypothetical protein
VFSIGSFLSVFGVLSSLSFLAIMSHRVIRGIMRSGR